MFFFCSLSSTLIRAGVAVQGPLVYLYNNYQVPFWGFSTWCLRYCKMANERHLPKNFKLWRCYYRWFHVYSFSTLKAICIWSWNILHNSTYKSCFLAQKLKCWKYFLWTFLIWKLKFNHVILSVVAGLLGHNY